MSRSATPYADYSGVVRNYGGFDVSLPTAGLYRFRLRSGGVYGAVRIWHGPPHDPVTGEELDRSWRWQASFNGEYIDLDRVWPACGRSPIDQREYDRLVQQAAWARENAPDSAYADHRRKVDRLSLNTPLPF